MPWNEKGPYKLRNINHKKVGQRIVIFSWEVKQHGFGKRAQKEGFIMGIYHGIIMGTCQEAAAGIHWAVLGQILYDLSTFKEPSNGENKYVFSIPWSGQRKAKVADKPKMPWEVWGGISCLSPWRGWRQKGKGWRVEKNFLKSMPSWVLKGQELNFCLPSAVG